jgi:hypothetical protein
MKGEKQGGFGLMTKLDGSGDGPYKLAGQREVSCSDMSRCRVGAPPIA